MVPFCLTLKAKLQGLAFVNAQQAGEEQPDSVNPISLEDISPVMTSASLSRTVSQSKQQNKKRGSIGDNGTAGLNTEAYQALIRVEGCEDDLRTILLVHVDQVAFKLEKEGIISAPPLVLLLAM